MWQWLKRSPRVPELTGAPPVRRQKTYSAQSGYVYQYFYRGLRTIPHRGAAATEYVFEVTADRHTAFPLSIVVPEAALEEWQHDHGRVLASAERYGLAKMALFQTFDDFPAPDQCHGPVELDPAGVSAFAEALDL